MVGLSALAGLCLLSLPLRAAGASAAAAAREEAAEQARYKPLREQFATLRQKITDRAPMERLRKQLETRLDRATDRMAARFDQAATRFTDTFNENAHAFREKAALGVDKLVGRASSQMGDAYSKAQRDLLGPTAEATAAAQGGKGAAPSGTEVSGRSAEQVVEAVRGNLRKEVQLAKEGKSSLLQAGVELGELQRLAESLEDGPLTRQVARLRAKANKSLNKVLDSMQKPMDRAAEQMASNLDTAINSFGKQSANLALYMSNGLTEATKRVTQQVADGLTERVGQEIGAAPTPEPAV